MRAAGASWAAVFVLLLGGCYTSLGAGVGGGRRNGEHSVRGTGSVAIGGALDIGGARFGLGAVPVGQSLSYGAEARTEICLRSRSREVWHRALLPSCSVSDLVRGHSQTSDSPGFRTHVFEDSPVEDAPYRRHMTRLLSTLGHRPRLGETPYSSSEVARVIEYFNIATGLFYSQRWFDDRDSDWTAGVFLELSLSARLPGAIADAAMRKPH
jgi:hypothetical protein